MHRQIAAFVLRRIAAFAGVEVSLTRLAAHEFAGASFPEGLGNPFIRLILWHIISSEDRQ